MTKQGVRNLNGLGPKRKKPEAVAAEQADAAADVAQAAGDQPQPAVQPLPDAPADATTAER